jgi:hypothetical protein
MLTSTEANRLTSAIDKMLMNVGKTNGTKLPASKSNTGDIALQYWLATVVSRFANNLMKKATKDAIKAGVIFDHKRDPLGPNIHRQLYNSDVVTISIETRNEGTRVDTETLRKELTKRGVKDGVLDAAWAAAIKKSAAPHFFSATLVEKPD